MKHIYVLTLLAIFAGYNTHAATSEQTATKTVFLKGISCAGKTSICNALQTRGWSVFDEDTFLSEQLAVHIQSRFPKEFELIEQAISRKNIPHAIMRSQILFEPSASLNDRQRASLALNELQAQLNQATEENEQTTTEWVKSLQTTIFKAIEQRARESNLAIDSWFLNADSMQELQRRLDAKTVLIYAPLPDLVRRTIKRNSDALIEGTCIISMRFFRQTFSEFFDNYVLSCDATNSLSTLTKADFLHTCNIINLCLRSSGDLQQTKQFFTRTEFSQESFAAFCQPILQQFEDHDTLYVALKRPYNHIIHTDVIPPDYAAEQITKLID